MERDRQTWQHPHSAEAGPVPESDLTNLVIVASIALFVPLMLGLAPLLRMIGHWVGQPGYDSVLMPATNAGHPEEVDA